MQIPSEKNEKHRFKNIQISGAKNIQAPVVQNVSVVLPL